MLLACPDILNTHIRLFHLSKSWYSWHSANIYCFACLFPGIASLSFGKLTPTSMWFYWRWLIRERQKTACQLGEGSGGRPHEVGTIILMKTMRKLKPREVIKLSEGQTVFNFFCKKLIQALLLPVSNYQGQFKPYLSMFNQRGEKKPYFFELLNYFPRAALINYCKTGVFKQQIFILSQSGDHKSESPWRLQGKIYSMPLSASGGSGRI